MNAKVFNAEDAVSPAGPRGGEPILVGVLHSLTGTMADNEKHLVAAAQMAIDEINESGGVLGRPVKSLIRDGASTPAVFASLARSLVKEDQVDTIFGCWTSSSRKAVRPVVEKHNSLLWYPVQYEGLEESPNIIYTGSCLNQQIEPAVHWALSQGKKRCFLVGSDYVFPRTANSLIRALVSHAGGEVLGEYYAPLGSTEFAETSAAVAMARPDIVFNTINGDSNFPFFYSFRAVMGRPDDCPILSFSFSETESHQIRAEAAGHYACWSYFQGVSTSENNRFLGKWRRKFGSSAVVSDPIATAYAQVHLWKQVVEDAGSPAAQDVLEHVVGCRADWPGGTLEVRANHHVMKPALVGRAADNGQFDIVWSSDGPIEPKPWLGSEEMLTGAADLVKEALSQYPEVVHLNWKLKQELANRRRAEKSMRQAHEEVMRLNSELEDRVAERTAELTAANEALMDDITKRKMLEAQLLQSQKMEAVGCLAGGIAHDFRNQLSVILGYAEMLRVRMGQEGKESVEICEILRAANRSTELTGRLMAFSRKEILNPKTVAPMELIEDLVESLQHIIGEDITMTTSGPGDLGDITVDPGQFEHMLMNLVVNARDAMPDGGDIRISVELMEADDEFIVRNPDAAPGHYVVITVSDTGIGMDSETRERAFEPFYTTKEVGEGTGLGLSMVYGFVKQSGGCIIIDSEPGHGTTFTIHLPMASKPAAEIETHGDSLHSDVSGDHATILLAEDEQAIRRMMTTILKLRGHTVLSAENARSALSLSDNYDGRIDLLVTDVIMPGMNGIELAEKIRIKRPDTAVIFMSGYGDSDLIRRGLTGVNAELLVKPLKVDEFLETVNLRLAQRGSRSKT